MILQGSMLNHSSLCIVCYNRAVAGKDRGMSAQRQPYKINDEAEQEFARYLDNAKHENKPAEVEIAGNRYRLVPVDDIQTTDEPNAPYDPRKMRAAIHAAAGTMKGVNREELLADLRAERGQDSVGRPAEHCA